VAKSGQRTAGVFCLPQGSNQLDNHRPLIVLNTPHSGERDAHLLRRFAVFLNGSSELF
jgi:hypothetical protein